MVAALRALRPARTGWAIDLAPLLAAERGRFALWLPVFMGVGVLLYFDLRFEPAWWTGLAVAVPAGIGAAIGRSLPLLRALLLSLTAAGLGFGAAQLATARAPAVEPVPSRAVILSGRVLGTEVVPNGRRVLLATVRLTPDAEPSVRRMRVRLRADDPLVPEAGDIIRLRAMLRAPAPPALPGGWDLQRDAFFSGLGAVGFALNRAELIEPGVPAGPIGWIRRLRDTIERRIIAAIPGPAGAVSSSLLTGAMGSIPPADMAAFRDSGLAHLLSVSGLHISIVMGVAFGAVRLLLAVSERAALFWPCKQIAAIAALCVGAFYMVLTGTQVPMVRSFAMACLFTVAVLAGRRAVSLRGLALAAVALLLVEPWQLAGASLQMSFAAVLALIAGFEALRPALQRLHRDPRRMRRVTFHLFGLVMTSLLAGTATLPFGAYHFGRIQIYYVLSNILAVPITSVLVMPSGMAALALMPLGLEQVALVPMSWGVEAMLWIARITAAAPEATLAVPHMPGWGLAVLTLGMIWLGLWRSRLRLLGLPLLALGIASPCFEQPPDLLVSADARLIGVRTGQGVFMQHESGASKFTQESWERYWGVSQSFAMPAQGEAAADAIACTRSECLLRPRAGSAAALLLRKPGSVTRCEEAAIVVSPEPARGRCRAPGVQLLDRFTVWRHGAHAVWLTPDGVRMVSDHAVRGERPWVPVPTPRRDEKERPAGRRDPERQSLLPVSTS